MIKAKHHIFIYPFFKWFTVRKLKSTFNKIEIIGTCKDENLPVLVIANHISWWDGFWVMYLNMQKFHRKFYFMMLEEQLRKHWYFNFTGGYSVRKSSRSIIDTLNYTAELLEHSSNMVLLFPQGRITSMHNQEIKFEAGVERIIDLCSGRLQIVFVANIIEYLSHPKPSLYMHITSFSGENTDKNTLEAEYNSFYQQAIQYHKTFSD